MRWLWSGIFCIIYLPLLFGQCPISDFSLPAEACLDERLKLENQTSNSVGFEWFLCDANYSAIPSKEKIVSGFGAVYNSRFVHDGSALYLFFVSQTQNKLVGLRFNDENSWDFEVHSDIDLSSIITNPAGIEIVNDNGTWTVLITSIVSPFKLVRVVLDTDFKTITHHDDLSSLVSLSASFDIKIVKDGASYVGFVSNSTGPVDKQLIRLSFGSSLSNIPTVSYIGLPAGSSAASIEPYRTCDEWTVFVSTRNGKLLRVGLGADPLTSSPTVTDLTLSVALSDPGGMALVEDHDELIFILQSRNGDTYTGKITSVNDNTVDITNLGNIKTTSRDWDIETYRLNGSYKVVSASFASGSLGGLYALEFAEQCPANKQFSTLQSEKISFQEQGTFKVTLKSRNAEGDFNVASKEITVAAHHAPQIAITRPGVYCANSSIPFHITSDLTLTNQYWDFGDGTGVSSQPSPTYSYTQPGSFNVTTNATADNGCSNFLESQIVIYEKPESDFQLALGLLCTNNEFIFSTTTPDIYDGNLAYQWLIDNNPISTQRDLQHTFTTTGAKEITLVTSIPGCSDEVTKITSPVASGPFVDFSFSGACEDETFAFQSQVSDPVQSYVWDFGNGETSPDPNPELTFADHGDYHVSLTATNTIGCETVSAKMVSVHSKPFVDFTTDVPPNGCSGTITEFENQSFNPDGRQITEWLWSFNDPNDPEPGNEIHGEHTFQVAASYNVSLTVTTEDGCISSDEKQVTIHQSPSTNFISTPACDDVPVLFSSAGSDIADWYWEIGTSYYTISSPTHTFKSPGDYPLYLEVTGTNGCTAIITRDIHVPAPLVPDFSIIKNCVGQEAILTDLTSGVDPVVSREWKFQNGETFAASPLNYVFMKDGNEDLSLRVTTQTGCVYAINRRVNIVNPPVAEFSSSPASGAYPLEVAFSNTSSGASHYLWNFGDPTGNTSVDSSPVYSFLEEGSFDVQLTAYNIQQCEHSITHAITTVAPMPDVDIELLTLTPNPDGSSKLIITIHNKGNTILKGLPMELDFEGNLALREIITGPVPPASRYNFVFNTGILNFESLRYLCVFLDLDNDLQPSGNRMCREFENRLFSFPAYPNPASENMNLEWISESGKLVHISLIDGLGRTIFSDELTANEGLNRRTLILTGLKDGMYTLLIEDDSTRNTQRIVVINKQ